MNAKKELLDHIEDRGVKYARVIRVSVIREHSYDNKETIDGTLDEVLPMLDFEYDNGYGRQELYGTIWYSDGTWSDRQECDGAEWWEHGPLAILPTERHSEPQ